MTEITGFKVHRIRGRYSLCTFQLVDRLAWVVLEASARWAAHIDGIEFETEDEARKYFEERTEERCQ